MNYKQLKQKLKNNIAQKKANRALYEHYSELLAVSTGELRFKNMKVDYLLGVLDEIQSMTDDKLVKGVIKNAIERDNLDTLIHSRLILNDK